MFEYHKFYQEIQKNRPIVDKFYDLQERNVEIKANPDENMKIFFKLKQKVKNRDRESREQIVHLKDLDVYTEVTNKEEFFP